jgi:hypothetical protein
MSYAGGGLGAVGGQGSGGRNTPATSEHCNNIRENDVT